MFGFSLSKLLVLALVIAAVWYGWKWFERQNRKAVDDNSTDDAREVDLIPCAGCGTYVPRGTEHCGNVQRGDGA